MSADNVALSCPWYRGVGKCVSGCWSEPSCQTDEPLTGWHWRDEHGQFARNPYERGWADGEAGKDPDFDRLALGANRLNDYERGYIDSGKVSDSDG